MKIIPFGCSHMAGIVHYLEENGYNELLYSNPNHTTTAYGGNSNHKIINDIYEYVNSTDFNKNVILYIQYTYTNRLWLPSKLNNPFTSFHSFQLEGCGVYFSNKFAQYELLNFYETYIKYFWDYESHLKELFKKINLLESFLKEKNIKFIQTFFTFGGHSPEWNNLFEKKEHSLDNFKLEEYLKNISYTKINGFESVTDYVKFLDMDVNDKYLKDNQHLSHAVNKKIVDSLYTEFENLHNTLD